MDGRGGADAASWAAWGPGASLGPALLLQDQEEHPAGALTGEPSSPADLSTPPSALYPSGTERRLVESHLKHQEEEHPPVASCSVQEGPLSASCQICFCWRYFSNGSKKTMKQIEINKKLQIKTLF